MNKHTLLSTHVKTVAVKNDFVQEPSFFLYRSYEPRLNSSDIANPEIERIKKNRQ